MRQEASTKIGEHKRFTIFVAGGGFLLWGALAWFLVDLFVGGNAYLMAAVAGGFFALWVMNGSFFLDREERGRKHEAFVRELIREETAYRMTHVSPLTGKVVGLCRIGYPAR